MKVVELLGAERPDHSLVSAEDVDLLERVVKSVFASFALHRCDWKEGLPS